MFNNEYNNGNNMKLSHPVYQISRKEPKFSKINGNTEYVKRDMNFDDDDDDEIDNIDNDTSSNYSIAAAFDSLKKNRKSVSRGNSRNNIRINNKNCYDYSYYNDNPPINRNINTTDNEKRIYHESRSDNSIPLSDESESECIEDNKNIENYEENDMESDNKNNSSSEIIKVVPRNKTNNNEEEQFNEFFNDDLGLTTEGRMTLMNLSLEKKWEIFKLQKDKVNNECNNPNINPSSYDNSPKYFINLLKKKSINTKMLTKLRFMISDDSSKCNKDWTIHEHLIRCIRGFFHSRIGLETLYSDPTPLLLLTLSLFYHQLIHIKKDINDDNSVQSVFLSSPSVLPLSNRTLILDMLSYLTKIETPLGWNMVVDALHWVSLGNGDKDVYLEDIKNRLSLSKEKYKQGIHSKKTIKTKTKTLKSFKFASPSNIPKNLLKQSSIVSQKGKSFKGSNDKNKSDKKINNTQSFLSNSSNASNLNLTFSEMFTEEFSYHLAFTLLQEEYQLQGYQDFNKESSGIYHILNNQTSGSDITSYSQESNSTSLEDLNQEDSLKQNSSQNQAALTFPRNRKINIYSQNNNETNLLDVSSIASSVPNLNNRKQPSKENSYIDNDSSFNNFDSYSKQFTSCTMNSESTIANNSVNYLYSNISLNDNENELKKYNIKNQHQIKKNQVNQSGYNNIFNSNKNLYANVPKFCPFTFWMKDFEDCAKEYNQLFLGNNLSSKIIYNTIANKTYRWAPIVSTPKEAVDQEQAINYIVIINIVNQLTL
ncbi:hypothetical protein PIROE2DRAFT_56647 [Piromyces sp. E2]|nr:hypothetical protein PIROE2DRAFT_56647 [Piromyces sp. E2]|eukprot:OUM70553.1 hypothetical protein PIROE2DRAFT_56647 [Piromyces sp. E2]